MGLDLKPYITDNKAFGGDPWLSLQSVSALTKTYNAGGSYAPNSPIALFGDTRGGYVKNFNYGSDLRTYLEWKIPGVSGLKALFVGSFAFNSGRTKTWSAFVPTFNETGTSPNAWNRAMVCRR